MKLNKFIADAGIASRRAAVDLIKAGHVTVNGRVEKTPGYEVQDSDVVCFQDMRIRRAKKVYFLLNKPSGYITSASDERGRKTVVDIVAPACNERIYPVGRLDRNTTGALLLTNDGDLAQKLLHPSHGVEKEYVATLDKPFASEDLQKLKRGVKLEDGFLKPDYIGYAHGAPQNVVVVKLHSGKNHVVKRLFQAAGYFVEALHRTSFGPLTLHGLGKGKFRMLTSDEVAELEQL